MDIRPEQVISIAEAEQNFCEVADKAKALGEVVLFDGSQPKYRLIAIENDPDYAMSEQEYIDMMSTHLMEKYRTVLDKLS